MKTKSGDHMGGVNRPGRPLPRWASLLGRTEEPRPFKRTIPLNVGALSVRSAQNGLQTSEFDGTIPKLGGLYGPL